VLALATGCVVTPPTRSVWPCDTELDCEEGFVCDARAGDPEWACAPRCTTSSDCPEGATCLPNGACAAACSFTTGGRPVQGCAEGLSCGRLQYPFGATPASVGLCGRAPTCTVDTECPADMRCATSTLTALSGLSNLPCVPVPDERGACPSSWVRTDLGCLPNCDSPSGTVACPPGMACYEGRAAPLGARESESLCFFGFYGALCRSDVECFVGRCADVPGGGRQCTERCDDAARVSGRPRATACGALVDDAGPFGVHLEMRCGSDDADAVCVARGGVGAGCREGSDCLEGFECRDGECTRDCTTSEDCRASGAQNPLADGFCDLELAHCRRLLPRDAVCVLDEECVTGSCLFPALDPRGARRCGVPRPVGSPCGRDEDCASGRCRPGGLGVQVCAPL
jgi:hypothetical protein